MQYSAAGWRALKKTFKPKVRRTTTLSTSAVMSWPAWPSLSADLVSRASLRFARPIRRCEALLRAWLAGVLCPPRCSSACQEWLLASLAQEDDMQLAHGKLQMQRHLRSSKSR